jgi:glycosyltransferase involved in cell wall biosynthesis
MQSTFSPNAVQSHIALNAQLLKLGQTYRSAGITNYIYQLVCHLAEAQAFRYTLWTGESRPEFEGMRQRSTRLPVHNPMVRIAWEQLIQPVEILKVNPDLIHGLAFVLPLINRVPGIITIFDLSFFRVPDAFNPLNRLYLQTMSKISAKRAVHICAIAEHGKQDIIEQFGVNTDKVTVVYPGTDRRFATPPTSDAVAAFRREKGLPERFVLYMGTLEPRKNIPLLVRAFAKVRQQLPGLKLVLAGGKGWGYENIFAEVVQLGLKEEVLFPGFIPSEEQALWYGAAELFVYPSRYEGFGLPPLEAMACGTPVITSNAASLREVVGTAGSTVDPHDEQGLVEVMEQLLTDGVLHAERRNAGLEQATTFRWEVSACTQAEVYRNALKQTV